MTCPLPPTPLAYAKALCLFLILLVCQIPNLFAQTPNGVVVAGGNGQGTALNQLAVPLGIHVDGSGTIYVADEYNHRIQKWAPGATQGMTVAGGNRAGSAANQLGFPVEVFVDGSGNIYVADNNNRIQKWIPGATQGATVAGGNGYGSATNQFSSSFGIHVDGGGYIYVADEANRRVLKFPPVPNYALTKPLRFAGGLSTLEVGIAYGIDGQISNQGTIMCPIVCTTIRLNEMVS